MAVLLIALLRHLLILYRISVDTRVRAMCAAHFPVPPRFGDGELGVNHSLR